MNCRSLPQGPFNTLVVVGESTVEGGRWLSKPEERWADILWKLLEHAQEQPLQYHNAGIGGDVISTASPGYEAVKHCCQERLESDVIAYNPDLVVIAYGLNDMRAGMNVSDFKIEMTKIIDCIRNTIQPLIVLANVYHMSHYEQHCPPFNRGSVNKTMEYNRMLLELAAEKTCAYADVWGAEGQKDYVVHPDTIHANKIGNMLIAHKVFETIVHSAPGIAINVNKRDATAHSAWRTQKLSRQAIRGKKQT